MQTLTLGVEGNNTWTCADDQMWCTPTNLSLVTMNQPDGSSCRGDWKDNLTVKSSSLVSLQPKKLGFSNLTHLRRRRPDESTDYICPMESSSPQSGQTAVNGVQMRSYVGFRGLSPILDREPDRSRDQVGLNDDRSDPSPWQQLWQQHGDTMSTSWTTMLSRFSISQSVITTATLLPLLAAHHTSARSLPAPLNPTHQPDPVPYEWRDLTDAQINLPDCATVASCLSWRVYWHNESYTLEVISFPVRCLTNPTSASNLCHLTHLERTLPLFGLHFLWHHFL